MPAEGAERSDASAAPFRERRLRLEPTMTMTSEPALGRENSFPNSRKIYVQGSERSIRVPMTATSNASLVGKCR